MATPLPPAPSFAFIDQAQRDVLFALFDAVVPSIASASHAARTKDGSTVAVADDEFERALDAAVGADAESRSRESLAAFLRHRPSQDPNFQKRCLSILAISPQRMQLVKVLELMRWASSPLLVLPLLLRPLSFTHTHGYGRGGARQLTRTPTQVASRQPALHRSLDAD